MEFIEDVGFQSCNRVVRRGQRGGGHIVGVIYRMVG